MMTLLEVAGVYLSVGIIYSVIVSAIVDREPFWLVAWRALTWPYWVWR